MARLTVHFSLNMINILVALDVVGSVVVRGDVQCNESALCARSLALRVEARALFCFCQSRRWRSALVTWLHCKHAKYVQFLLFVLKTEQYILSVLLLVPTCHELNFT